MLDIDQRNNGFRTLQKREKKLGTLPPTVTTLTGGGGRHHIFSCPRFKIRKDSAGKTFGEGVNVLADAMPQFAGPNIESILRCAWI